MWQVSRTRQQDSQTDLASLAKVRIEVCRIASPDQLNMTPIGAIVWIKVPSETKLSKTISQV